MKISIPGSGRDPTTRVIVLTVEQRQELEGIVRKGTVEHRMVQRSRMVLLCAERVPLREVGRRLVVHRNNVRRWCDRYMKIGLAGLSDRPRSGRPRSLSLRRSA
jgi:putative transposase